MAAGDVCQPFYRLRGERGHLFQGRYKALLVDELGWPLGAQAFKMTLVKDHTRSATSRGSEASGARLPRVTTRTNGGAPTPKSAGYAEDLRVLRQNFARGNEFLGHAHGHTVRWRADGVPMACRWRADGVPMACRWRADGVPMACDFAITFRFKKSNLLSI
jgi:hypothetical protein